jgi:hypothetical protein
MATGVILLPLVSDVIAVVALRYLYRLLVFF